MEFREFEVARDPDCPLCGDRPTQTVLAQTVLAKGRDKTWKITGFHVTFEGLTVPPPAGDAVTVDKPKAT